MQSPSPSPRVLLIPNAGMGHLSPFVRLAQVLSDRNVAVSLLTARPTVSDAESRLLSSLPSSLVHDFSLPQLDPSLFSPFPDPFFLRMESLRRFGKNLSPLLSSFSSIVVDMFAASTFLPIAADANIPCFVFFTSSATMLAVFAAFGSQGDADIPGVVKISPFFLSRALLDPNHIFTRIFMESGRALSLASGILVNTFETLEPEIMATLNSGKVSSSLPPVYAIGPLPLLKEPEFLTSTPALWWLDAQPERSVLYVSFGSRTVMSMSQMKELQAGLEMSQCRFLLVVKWALVDREEAASEKMEELVGEGRGLVVREWVEQEVILGHRAVGGFLSHCGWNSVIEAAVAGVRVLAWPRIGDQRVHAGVVKRSGVGLWVEEWAWDEDEGVVAAEEIGKRVRELMEDERTGEMTVKVAADAAAAVAEGGSSDVSIGTFVDAIVRTNQL